MKHFRLASLFLLSTLSSAYAEKASFLGCQSLPSKHSTLFECAAEINGFEVGDDPDQILRELIHRNLPENIRGYPELAASSTAFTPRFCSPLESCTQHKSVIFFGRANINF